jgi:solute carrier family 25 carnitine/acylcarnitine transporter 20/29
MGAPLVGVAPIFAVCFASYGAATQALLGAAPGGAASRAGGVGVAALSPTLSLPLVAVAGALSAFPTTLLAAPGERIKVLLQANAGQANFRGPTDVLRSLWSSGGLASLYRGAGATLARDAAGSSVYFSAYEGVKRSCVTEDRAPPSTATVLLAGSAAGVANWLVALPVDVVKSKVQASLAQGPTAMQIAATIMRTQGLVGFYVGLAPALLRAVPANAACFWGVNAANKWLDAFV